MASDIRVAITGVEGYVPETKLTNKDLETLVETNDAWITERVGIKERRILKDPEKASVFMGAEAVKGLLKDYPDLDFSAELSGFERMLVK